MFSYVFNMNELQFCAGQLKGSHCGWPGVTCSGYPDQCKVTKLECKNCNGHLPERINLKELNEVPGLLSIRVEEFEGHLKRLLLGRG